MPIYNYICKDCGEKFNLLVGVSSEKVELKCKKCGSLNIKKILASFSMGASSSGKSKPSDPGCSTGICPTCF